MAIGLGCPGWRSDLGVVRAVFRARLRTIMRYRGGLLLEAFLPVVVASVPILLGIAVAGGEEAAAANFAANTSADDYRLYLLIGADAFTVVAIMLWVVAFWVRREMESGTLEALYLAPAKRVYVVSGVASYAFLRAILAFALGIFVGSLILGVNPLKGSILLALAFLLLGMVPLWGLSFLFGALIMRIREANSVVSLLQWVVSFAMGVFFPITALPPVLRWAVLLFPPTWMAHDVRAAILDLAYFLGTWYMDMAALMAFALAVPLLGYWTFAKMEGRLKRREGVGQF
jgi:ABC-type multidrug transport system permease subunit